jgi:hypothetical protein
MMLVFSSLFENLFETSDRKNVYNTCAGIIPPNVPCPFRKPENMIVNDKKIKITVTQKLIRTIKLSNTEGFARFLRSR